MDDPLFGKVKVEITNQVEMLFVNTSVNQLTGNTAKYLEGLEKIAALAKMLGVDTVITTTTIDLESGTKKIEETKTARAKQ